MTLWLYPAMMLCCLAGFLALALASERPGPQLLGYAPGKETRRRLRLAGWPLLALALALGIAVRGISVGQVTWFAWLTMAGAALVFAFPYYERARSKPQPARRAKKPAPPVALLPPLRSRPARAIATVLLIAIPLGGLAAILLWPVQPVLRADAIEGQAGPFSFTIAEYDRGPPRFAIEGVPAKAFALRFCETCDEDIRAAYLKVNRPRSLRGAGLVFSGDRWSRFVEIQLPSAARADSELWLTVEGKDGTLHYASWKLSEIVPATAEWLAQQRQNP